jgi:hypothetical protein
MGMSGTAIAASRGIDPYSELDEVFGHFHARLENIPGSPRSVAEASITSDDLGSLIEWFSDLHKKPRMWCDDPWQRKIAGIGNVSNQEMFGALLIILASEVCRDKSSEEELWPAVAAVLEKDKHSFPLLFDGNRQPGALCKKAMAEGSRRLNLRNLIDCSGNRQEYVDTVRLQFGFTLRGARKRLPDWLAGLGRPVAVRILCGDEGGFEHLKSASFSKLWKTLDGLRRRRIERDYAASVLQTSAWIRPEWVDEILTLTEASANRVYSPFSVSHGGSATVDAASEPVCELTLRWEAGSKPRFRLRINDDRACEILGASRKAQFAVDGTTVGTWVAQEGGDWHGERELPCEGKLSLTNLRPGLLTISGDSKLLEEVDLSDLGTGEALSIFDLRSGEPVNLNARLDPGRDYAFICDTDLSVPGATQLTKSKNRCAYRVVSPWPKDLRVVCEGLTYWRPMLVDTDPPRQFNVGLESLPGQIAEPGSVSRLFLTGIPDDATVVSLTVGQMFYPVARKAGTWEPESPVRITTEMALRKERLRIRIEGEGYGRSVVPKLSIKLRGIACMESDAHEDSELRWEFLNRQRPLNRAGGAGNTRVFVETPASWLYEGAYRVGRVGNRPLPLRDLHGWGAPLLVRADDGTQLVMVGSVEDKGSGRFQPPMLRNAPAIHWRAPVLPGREHKVLVWSNLQGDPRLFSSDQIESHRDGLVWRLPDSGFVAAMAVAHQGARHTSFWNVERTGQALRQFPSSKLFALLRWLHLPVLSPEFIGLIQQAAVRAPAEFVTGWLLDASLPYALVHRPCEPGLHVVIRALLWNHIEKNEITMDKIALAFQEPSANGVQRSEADVFKNALLSLGLVCPSLAYSHAVKKVRGDKYKRCAKSVAASMLRLPDNADAEQLRIQLASARRENAELIGLSSASLEAGEAAFAAHLDNPAAGYSQFEAALRRLGETSRGPQFLTASLLLRFVERSRY